MNTDDQPALGLQRGAGVKENRTYWTAFSLRPASTAVRFRSLARQGGHGTPRTSFLRFLGWSAGALVVANEIRGLVVVITAGPPLLEATWRAVAP